MPLLQLWWFIFVMTYPKIFWTFLAYIGKSEHSCHYYERILSISRRKGNLIWGFNLFKTNIYSGITQWDYWIWNLLMVWKSGNPISKLNWINFDKYFAKNWKIFDKLRNYRWRLCVELLIWWKYLKNADTHANGKEFPIC